MAATPARPARQRANGTPREHDKPCPHQVCIYTIGKSPMKNGVINVAHPFPGRWLPLIVFAALILVLSGALFGLVFLHDNAGTPDNHSIHRGQ
jgi:hypothetical protein